MIKAIRLVTGEDIISEINDIIVDGNIELINPIQLITMPGKTQTQPNFAFIPFPLYISSDIKEFKLSIKEENVIFMVDPAVEFINQYKSLFGGIIAPSKNIIV